MFQKLRTTSSIKILMKPLEQDNHFNHVFGIVRDGKRIRDVDHN